jgi:hypothetical protein
VLHAHKFDGTLRIDGHYTPKEYDIFLGPNNATCLLHLLAMYQQLLCCSIMMIVFKVKQTKSLCSVWKITWPMSNHGWLELGQRVGAAIKLMVGHNKNHYINNNANAKMELAKETFVVLLLYPLILLFAGYRTNEPTSIWKSVGRWSWPIASFGSGEILVHLAVPVAATSTSSGRSSTREQDHHTGRRCRSIFE